MADNQYSTNIIAHPYSKERCERKVNKRRKRNWNRLEKKASDHSTSTELKKKKGKDRGRKGRGGRKTVPLPGDCWRAPRRGQRGLMSQAGGHLLSTTTTINHTRTRRVTTKQSTWRQTRHSNSHTNTSSRSIPHRPPRVQPGNARGYERQRNEKEQEREAVSSCWTYSSGDSTYKSEDLQIMQI